MKILFSQIGNSDPWRGIRDGPMLHIVRKYKPSVVWLFFTESLWGKEAEGYKHKEYKWAEIIQHVNPGTKVEIFVEDVDAHDFETFKDLFHDKINQLQRLNPEAELLLNATSGTPQMISTLALEHVTNPNSSKFIQVTTPQKKSNLGLDHAKTEDQEEEFEYVELEESAPDVEDRTIELEILSFRKTMIRAQLEKMLEYYDYSGAYSLLNSEKGLTNRKAIKSVLAEILDDINGHRIFKEIHDKYRNMKMKQALCQFLILNMRFKRKNYADVLIRAKSIAEFILKEYIHKQYPNLIIEENGKVRLNYNYHGSIKEQYERATSGRTSHRDNNLNMWSYIHILRLDEKHRVMLNWAEEINKFNDSRNKIAHNLEPVFRHGEDKDVKILVDSVEKMLKKMYPEIKDHSFHYFETKNEEILALFDSK